MRHAVRGRGSESRVTRLRPPRPRSEAFARYLPGAKAVGIMLYVEASANGADIQCRMFAPLFGVTEDPATGSAAVALIGLLASLDARTDGTIEKVFAQGFEMGRPSLLARQRRQGRREGHGDLCRRQMRAGDARHRRS